MRTSRVSVAGVHSVRTVFMLLVITVTKITEASFHYDLEGSGMDLDDIYSGLGSGSGSGSGGGYLSQSDEQKPTATVMQMLPSVTPNSLQSTSKVSLTTISSEVTEEATVVAANPEPKHNPKISVENVVTEQTTTLPPSTTLPAIIPDDSEETVIGLGNIPSHDSTTPLDHSLTSMSKGAHIALEGRRFLPSEATSASNVDDDRKLKAEKETDNAITKDNGMYFPEEPKIIPNQHTPIKNSLEDVNNGSEFSQSKGLLERGEIVAAVVAGGAVGLILAVLLVVLLVYRMKKKDEGTYTLEETKQPNGGYQKPIKQEEFYA